MSRRPNPAADRAAQNAQTLKALVKLEGNKVCADCKRNKHPRWASWNLGVFICIRCSGIHRGMGTHISRVKSVDLDAWTDEQLQSVLKWGNSRANKYWEAKLAAGHAPSEAKIENFIRTKYDTKRWIMDGPMPDPSTLDGDDDDNVPLSVVQEKAVIERAAPQKAAQAPSRPLQPPQPAAPQTINLFDDFPAEPPARPSTTDIPTAKAAVAPPAKAKQESLLGLDFFGSSQGAGIGRPASASSNPAPATNSRGDLKNSILSLYASAPKPQPAAQQTHNRQTSLTGISPQTQVPQDSFSALNDAFSGLTFPDNKVMSPTTQPSSTTPAFSGLNFGSPAMSKATPAAPQMTSPPPLSGGSFFDAAPAKPASSKPTAPSSNAFDGLNFAFSQNTTSSAASKPGVSAKPVNLFNDDDGFDSFASAPPAPAPVRATIAPAQPTSSPVSNFNSAFNLSSAQPLAKSEPPKAATPAASVQSNSALFDPWGGNDTNAWGAPEPAKPTAPKVELGSVPTHITPNDISGGWGAPISSSSKPTSQPAMTADEDFGGWTSAPVQTPRGAAGKQSGFGASDPFDNPWG